jgi:L-threonine kinase
LSEPASNGKQWEKLMPNEMPSVTVTVPGTCGELLQGWSETWAEPVLVSCPIAHYSQIEVQLQPTARIITPQPPQNYVKIYRAARLLLEELGRPDLGVILKVESQLRPSCGMASSTADVVGTLVGLATLLGHPLNPDDLARLACQIEPSDSTMFRGLTLFAYRGSARHLTLGQVPPLPLLLLEAGPGVDTVVYNTNLDLTQLQKLAATTQEAMEMLQVGLITQQEQLIGTAATLSALSYQKISYDPFLEKAHCWATMTGALGVVRAHSGSIVGLLYPAQADLTGPFRWLTSRFQGLITLTCLTNESFQVSNNQPYFERQTV